MKKIALSLNPTYLCNFRCNFCYLTPEQLADKNKLDLNSLRTMLKEVKEKGYIFEHVDLYGGEVGLLSGDYLYEIDEILYEHNAESTLNVVTNLFKVPDFFYEDHISLSVSYDFECRERSSEVLQNMLLMKKDIAVLMLASPCLIKKDVTEMVTIFNGISNIKSVEIKPYSSNQANKLDVSYKEFEDFVIKWLEADKKFTLQNELNIKECIDLKSNSFSDDHVYITPNGKFGVLEFDKNDDEYFLELDSFEGYLSWANKEKKNVKENSYCKECKYLGTCLTEHYRDVKDLKNSCNGFYNLLSWGEINLR